MYLFNQEKWYSVTRLSAQAIMYNNSTIITEMCILRNVKKYFKINLIFFSPSLSIKSEIQNNINVRNQFTLFYRHTNIHYVKK